MKKLLVLSFVSMIFVFTSCDELGLPSLPIDQTFNETFTLTIDENTPAHVGDTVVIDLSDLDEFADITDQIDSMAIKQISMKFTEYDGPEGLYMSGELVASDDSFENTSISVGTVDPLSINEYYMNAEAVTLDIGAETVLQLTGWLTTNKEASVAYDFGLVDADGNNYVFTEEDYGKMVTINVSVIITAYVSSIPDFGI